MYQKLPAGLWKRRREDPMNRMKEPNLLLKGKRDLPTLLTLIKSTIRTGVRAVKKEDEREVKKVKREKRVAKKVKVKRAMAIKVEKRYPQPLGSISPNYLAILTLEVVVFEQDLVLRDTVTINKS